MAGALCGPNLVNCEALYCIQWQPSALADMNINKAKREGKYNIMLIIISAKLMCNTWQIQLAIMFAVVLPSSDLPSLAGENQFSDKKSEVI